MKDINKKISQSKNNHTIFDLRFRNAKQLHAREMRAEEERLEKEERKTEIAEKEA